MANLVTKVHFSQRPYIEAYIVRGKHGFLRSQSAVEAAWSDEQETQSGDPYRGGQDPSGADAHESTAPYLSAFAISSFRMLLSNLWLYSIL